MKPGDIVAVDFPGHALHGQRVRVERIEPAFNIAPDEAEECLVEMIFYTTPRFPGQWGIGPERLSGTAANARLRALEREDDSRQTELQI